MEQDDGLHDAETGAAPLAIESDERYRRLVAGRSRFAWTLTIVMLLIYFGYILLVAFRPDLLARPIGTGVTSLGIPLGLGVIVAGILLTAAYVRRANRVFDRDLDALRRDHGA
ncbi:MAG TPA: DUF485 domain-containing protein [Sphingopyxis sp.]|nr:DUF485 domain-containing protein [Sphingopyxis sp.]HMP44627.1 DUF485 domain-containing protein [Sphingopyxis sp.]HMQ18178.1 DUF485 domain-containing protein [Sphingopyxis sp.]